MNDIPSISKEAAIAWAGGSASELAKRLKVTVSAVSQWKDIPEGRLWQLRALGCPEDGAVPTEEQAR